VAETITALHQPHDQSMASPAGMRGPTTRSTYRTLVLNIVVTMFDIDDLLIYHPNIILTYDMYDILDNMHKYLCNHSHAREGHLFTQRHQITSLETRDSRLSYGEVPESLSHLALNLYWVVTDRQTDGRTDGRTEFP